jgi:hypothetical protein
MSPSDAHRRAAQEALEAAKQGWAPTDPQDAPASYAQIYAEIATAEATLYLADVLNDRLGELRAELKALNARAT